MLLLQLHARYKVEPNLCFDHVTGGDDIFKDIINLWDSHRILSLLDLKRIVFSTTVTPNEAALPYMQHI